MLENTDKLITAEDVNTTMQYHCKGLVYLMCGICFGPLWFHSTLWENVQVVRIYLWSKWLRARGYVWHAKVLTCGSILSLFWCPAVRVMVYVAEMPVLTMGANMLTPPFTNASPTHSSPLSGYTHHHPNTGSFLFLFSKETAPKKSIFTPLHDKIIVGERVFLVTPVTQCLEWDSLLGIGITMLLHYT